MKLLKWAFVTWAIMATLIIFLAILAMRKAPETEARAFCAYNRVFVEFSESGRTWGALMLDFNGKPIPCEEEADTITVDNTI